jgi:hypothetical protein
MARFQSYRSQQKLTRLRPRFSQALHPGRRGRYGRAFFRQLPALGACGLIATVLMIPSAYDTRTSRVVPRTKFASCDAARRVDATPIYIGEPAYSKWLDADRDGVACEFHWPTMIAVWSGRIAR